MTTTPTICFVVAASAEGDDELIARAAALVRCGWSVHLLSCAGEIAAGACIVIHRLDELPSLPGASLQRYGGDDPTVVLGERAQGALEALHADHRFDLVEFIDGAVAIRSVQSKRSAAAFLDLPLAVRLVAPDFHRRTDELRTLGAPRELKLDFCERYAFEHADVQLAARAALLAAAAARAWAVRPDAQADPVPGADGRTDQDVGDLYAGLLGRSSTTPATAAADPTLTIVVAHYNHEDYLPATLASLAAQTRPPDEVIVIDDGSTSAAALENFAVEEARYPNWRFIRQDNVGPGATRNRGLELATGSCFLPFDSDNIAVATMVEQLLGAMARNPDRAATTCHNLGFTESADIAASRFVSCYAPTGGPLVLGAVENVFGDTCAIFRTEALRSVGGFETNLWSPTEDWETFAKMVTRGLSVDVLPRPLFYYRTDAGGRLQHLGVDRGTKLRLRAHLLDQFFANAPVDERGRRELFEALQAFDAAAGVEARLAEQQRWHDAQMADLDAFREDQVERARSEQGARADAADAQVAVERARAETAERELAALRKATSGRLLGRAVRWRPR
jgi:hypothetical protein